MSFTDNPGGLQQSSCLCIAWPKAGPAWPSGWQ